MARAVIGARPEDGRQDQREDQKHRIAPEGQCGGAFGFAQPPRADLDNPYLEVSRKSVVFRFDGPWALLDMMQLLKSTEVADARASLLKLDIPVLADARDTTPRAKPVRAFVAITLSEPGKTAPLPWPAAFPERAPTLEK